MLTTELTSGHQLRAIPSENVARARVELALVEAEPYAADSLSRIRNNLGAEMIVLGSYLVHPAGTGAGGAASGAAVVGGEDGTPLPSGSAVRIDVRVQDTRTADLLTAFALTGSEQELVEIVSRIGRRLRSQLGVTELSGSELGELRAYQPDTTAAARQYTEGLARLRRFETREAISALQKVTAAEPGFALAHLALADAWSRLGFDQRARRQATQARPRAEQWAATAAAAAGRGAVSLQPV